MRRPMHEAAPRLARLARRGEALFGRLPPAWRAPLEATRPAERAYGLLLGRLTARGYVEAIVPWRHAAASVWGLRRFLRDRRHYESLSGERLPWEEDNPQLHDWSSTSPFDPHYTYQDAWAAREVHARRPRRHVDVGSRISFVAGLAAFMETVFIDLRPLQAQVPGLLALEGSVTALPLEDRSVESLSCLHVAEHIGLGRYGDELDPEGTRRAARELQRVLAPDGRLYFSVPVGRPRTAFNAHRVHDPLEVATLFSELELEAFAGVDDAGRFHPELEPAALRGAEWGCGFYRFRRP